MLPPSLQAMKDAARAKVEAANDKARQEQEARAAMSRDALRECIEETVSGDVLAAIGEIDLNSITADTNIFELACCFPGHLPLIAKFSRGAGLRLEWKRMEFAMPGTIWRVKRQGMSEEFIDLGPALLFAEHTPVEAADVAAKERMRQREALDEVPF